jgi:hypothetical protein
MKILAWVLLAASQDQPMDEEGIAFFEKHIRPILVERCLECHSAEAKQAKAGLYLDSRDGILRGGDSGPALVPRRPDQSVILKMLRESDPELAMPPKEKPRLTADQIKLFEVWISMGAPDPRSGRAPEPRKIDVEAARGAWPFKPVEDPAPPAVRDAAWPRNPIDRFVLKELEARGLRPVEEADRRTLIRRLSFDLIGLPPTPEEIGAFLADESPDAYEKLVERLLASPHYGERWGRHWLDVVRYADTAGDNSDYPVPQNYLYRNYVIDAFNRDLPFDRFIREQLAGDLLPHADEAERRRHTIATGYLANTRRFGSVVKDYPMHLQMEDAIDNLGRTFLALTVNCARCHDHKFDPVTGEDYYALYGILHSTRYPFPGIELDKVPRDLVPLVGPEQIEAAMKPVREQEAALAAGLRALEEEKKAEPSRAAELDKKIAEAKAAKDRFARRAPPYETAYAVVDGPSPADERMHIRGQPRNPGKQVPRRFLEVLGGRRLPEGTAGSGRRELADWIADHDNPLTARVMVNRIWQYHFGKGIVQTPGNFGKQGRPPTHPQLLDWLASRFVQSGWSIKAMHRLIVGSRTYRLGARADAANAQKDPVNDWLWRHDRRRLEAEAIRDAMLAVSGALDRSPADQPHPFPPQEKWEFTQHNPFVAVYETPRRSVYVMTQRIAAHPFLGIFDGADPNASTERRRASTTALQALYLMNNPFVHEQARKLGERLQAEAAGDAERIERAYLLALGRPASEAERAEAEAHLGRARELLGSAPASRSAEPQVWESFARAIFLSNEFLYVE